MKKYLHSFVILGSVLAQTLIAQTTVTLPAGTASTSPSPACLSCPGSDWSNEINVTASDGIPADVGLMQNAFCFQSTCYYSRSLISNQFGFSIPGTATITGIEITIKREAPAINSIRDTTVVLLQNGTVASLNYLSGTFWPAVYVSQVYGGPSNLWGLAWTPADINNPATSLRLGVYNKSAVSVSGVNVDYVSMTVYYSITTGIIESQSSAPASFSVNQAEENNILFLFATTEHSKINKLNVFDLSGRLVGAKDLGELDSGNHHESVPVKNLQSGIYLTQFVNDTKIISKKIIIR